MYLTLSDVEICKVLYDLSTFFSHEDCCSTRGLTLILFVFLFSDQGRQSKKDDERVRRD